MTEKAPLYNEKDKKIRGEVLLDWKHIVLEMQNAREGKESSLTPQKDWDLVWVLSGPEITLSPDEQETEGGNQTRERFATGLALLREVTALRLGKALEEVTGEDVQKYGPRLYYNGTKEHDLALRDWMNGTDFEGFKVPMESIELSDWPEDIRHTGDQFADFDKRFVPSASGKLVVVTDLYHLPRTKRYFDKGFPVPLKQTILYPSRPGILRVNRALSEVKKIPQYEKAGLFVPKGKTE